MKKRKFKKLFMSFCLVLVLSLPYHVIADNLDISADNDLSYVPHLDIEKMIEEPNIKLLF